MLNKCLFSSNSDEYETPQALFDELDKEFCFDIDVCGTEEKHKCKTYYTKEQNGLLKNWGGIGVFAIHHIHKLNCGLKRHSGKHATIILSL